MDESEFKQVTGRLLEVDSVIKEIDPALREGAWELLRPYVSGDDPGPSGPPSGSKPRDQKPKQTRQTRSKPKNSGKVSLPPSDNEEDSLIQKFESMEDAENLSLTLAIFYKRYGRGPFELTLLKNLASSLSIEIPKRPDKTLQPRKANIRKQEDGWKITPAGEKWLQDTYGVTRGKQPLPEPK
jgi:hypothetical protein